jgi:hypothetical protein
MSEDEIKCVCFDLVLALQVTKENTISIYIDGIDLFNELVSYSTLQNGKVEPLEMLAHIVRMI